MNPLSQLPRFLRIALQIQVLGIVLLSTSHLYATPKSDIAPVSGDISGQILRCAGSNDAISVYIAGTSFNAISDSSGNFKLSYVQPGTYNLTFVAGGGKIHSIAGVAITTRKTTPLGIIEICQDSDQDNFFEDVDCNDHNPAINPGAEEICGDGIDNNCDTTVDEGCTVCTDNDSDGFFAQEYCEGLADCDDSNASVNPVASEQCDAIDNNCNGNVDDNAIDTIDYFIDNDLDNFGSILAGNACSVPSGLFSSTSGDCDDTNGDINPGATEVPDNIDNNCNGFIDEVLYCSLGGGDSDLDGICDDVDVCPGSNDLIDSDDDGAPDGCDACPYSSEDDSDGDGVCENVDECLGDDAFGDSDGDHVCEDIDACTGDDASGDSDGDGICNDLDPD